jgi:hypothetical protein
MQIVLNLDEFLLNEAPLTNLTTHGDLIKLALQELVLSRRRKNLLHLAGQIQFSRILTIKTCVKLAMLLVNTFVWVSLFRNRSGQVHQQLETLISNREVLLTRFTQLELLQGSLNEQEWDLLSTYLEPQNYIKLTVQSWQATARV